jgi:calcineurin-like phosphoesterase family protein
VSATYFTSDLHIGHKFVAGLRGFSTFTEEDGTVYDLRGHTDAIIKAFSVVKPDDIVWILGDICISASTWASALNVLGDWCPGRKRLISGNHDPVANHHRDSWKYQKAALEVFESVHEYGRLKLAPRDSPYGGYALMSHYPYSGTGSDRGEERYTQYRLPDLGMPIIHGHTHGKEKLHFSDRGTPQIHVGLDAWDMQLVPVREIERLLLDTPVSSDTVGA